MPPEETIIQACPNMTIFWSLGGGIVTATVTVIMVFSPYKILAKDAVDKLLTSSCLTGAHKDI